MFLRFVGSSWSSKSTPRASKKSKKRPPSRKNEKREALSAPQSVQNHYLSAHVDVLERLQAQGGPPGNLRAAPGGPPGRHNVSKNLCLFKSLEEPALDRYRPEVGGILFVMLRVILFLLPIEPGFAGKATSQSSSSAS